MKNRDLEVTDDSGFLAILDISSYETFVARNWKFEQLMDHFQAQMKKHSLLIWGTGLEGFWNVLVTLKPFKKRGFRSVVGPLRTSGAVLVTNYEDLTSAAASQGRTLPEPHQKDAVIQLEAGDYTCRVVQMFDPEEDDCAKNGPDFVLELIRKKSLPESWSEVPWFSE